MFSGGPSQQVRDDPGEGGQGQVPLSHGEELGFYSRANEKLEEDSDQGIPPGCHGRMDFRGKKWKDVGELLQKFRQEKGVACTSMSFSHKRALASAGGTLHFKGLLSALWTRSPH